MSERILIYQMAKVGSYAWLKAIEAADPDAEVHHLHFLAPATLRKIEESISRRGDTQTVAHTPMLRHGIGRSGLHAETVDGRWRGGPVRIVSGIRDPVDRAASLLFFFADFYGSVRSRLSSREGATADSLVAYFIDAWESALAQRFGHGTFEQQLRIAFVRYRDWFEMELHGVFGLDVMQHHFDRDRGRLAVERDGGIAAFCYRFEDLRGPTWPRVAAAASDFLRLRIETLPVINETAGRRSRQLYQEFRERLVMPADLLDAIYSAPVVRHFYSPEEIAGFRQRWGS